MIEIQVPFHGFYESKWSMGIDDVETMYFDEWNGEYDHKIVEKMDVWRYAKYCWMYQNVAFEYVKYFNEWFKAEHGIDLELVFDGLSSPKYYNYSTDRIFAKMPKSKLSDLLELVDINKLRAEIKKRHTSCDGFISFYSNYLPDWIAKLQEGDIWDANEMHTLLQAVIDDEYDEYEWGIYEDMSEVFHNAFNEHFDWEGFKEEYENILSEQAEEDRASDS